MATFHIEQIQQGEPGVAERIHAIQIAAYTEEAKLLGAVWFPPLERTVADVASSRDCFFGAFLGGELVGLVSIERDAATREMSISSLVVAPAYQRRGAARALLSYVVSRWGQEGLRVSTGERNLPALALYAQFGFAVVAHRTVGPEALPLVVLRREVPRVL